VITAGPRNRTGPKGDQGPKGLQGEPGFPGLDGSSPEHQWRGTEIKFKKPSGLWGPWVDLKGKDGKAGGPGAPGANGDSNVQKAPKLIVNFGTPSDTLAKDFVVVTVDNFVTKISSNITAQMPNGIFGVAYEKTSSVTVDVIFVGVIGGYSGFTTGAPLFVQTSGLPGHTVPLTGMIQQIGFAVSPTEIFLNLLQPIRRD
jgi:hypothetical protein